MTRSTWTSARIKDSGTKKFSMNSHTPSPFSRKKPKFSLGKGFCQSIISNCQLSNRVTIPCPSVFSLDLISLPCGKEYELGFGDANILCFKCLDKLFWISRQACKVCWFWLRGAHITLQKLDGTRIGTWIPQTPNPCSCLRKRAWGRRQMPPTHCPGGVGVKLLEIHFLWTETPRWEQQGN